MLRLAGVAAVLAALVAAVPAVAAAGANRALVAPQKRLLLAPATRLANEQTYTDAVGDSGAVIADIASVQVANTNAGTVAFKVTFANRTDALDVDDVLQIPIDTDGAFYTGHNGFEYLLQVSIFGVELLKDAGGDYTFSDARVNGTLAGGVLTLELNIRDLSDTASLRFYVAADTVSPSPGEYDWAPDGDALFRYTVDVPLLLDQWDAVQPAKAGTTFSLSGVFTTNDVERGTVTCAATVGGKRVAGTARWNTTPVLPASPPSPEFVMPGPFAYKAAAGCSFKLSKISRRKTLKGTITVSKDGVVVRRAFSLRVR